MNLDDLHGLSDEDVKTKVKEVFLLMIKKSPSISDFFSNIPASPIDPINKNFVDDVACSLFCSAISRISLYGFYKTIDQQKADKYWQAKLKSEQANEEINAIYDWAFPDYCKSDRHKFREYLNENPKEWATNYAERIKNPIFMNIEIRMCLAAQF
jgi:hypothetical protein